MGSIAVHRIQHKLNMLHSDMFPLLGDCGTGIVKGNVRFYGGTFAQDDY